MMGTFIDDAIYNYLNTDAEPANDIDLFFNNAGGIRTDWCYDRQRLGRTPAASLGLHAPALLTYGNMFTVLPFGNATVVGDDDRRPDPRGAQLRRRNVATASSSPPASSTSTSRTRTRIPGPQPYAWGAFDVLRRQQDHEGLRAARPEQDLQGRHQRVPGAGRRRWLRRLQVHDQHHVLGRHAQCGQRVRGQQLRHRGDRLQGSQRRRDARRPHRPRRRPTPAAASSRSRSCTTTTRTATWPRAHTSATPSLPR